MKRTIVFATVLTVIVLLVSAFAIPVKQVSAAAQVGGSNYIPTPLAPVNMIMTTTPEYKWTRVENATQYRFRVFEGTNTQAKFTRTVMAQNCYSTYCAVTPGNKLESKKYQWQVQAYVNGQWRGYSNRKHLSIVVPVPLEPAGIINDNTPTFAWTVVEGASQYRFQVFKAGTTMVYYKNIVPVANCDTTKCSFTITKELPEGKYRWKVQAFIGTDWRPYSILKYFTVDMD